MKKQWVFAAALMAFSASSMAVDGYKNLKFGMSEKEVIESNLCSFRYYPARESTYAKIEDDYDCHDFQFGDKKVRAIALFLNGKLSRLGIVVTTDDYNSVLTALRSKYGPGTESPDPSQKRLLTVPGTQYAISFDNDTVELMSYSDEQLVIHTQIIYTIPDFFEKRDKLISAHISNDV
ncbi:hypothetical protein [Serratia fonticola]|uniref:hypothetical protein n=1 Tax=Serratia fonticola TaxID=47917 RepID=UPI00301CF6B2